MDRSRWMLVLATFALLTMLASALAACAAAATSTPLYPLPPTSTAAPPAPTITPVPTATPNPIPTATLTAYASPCLTSQLSVRASFGGAAMTEVGTIFTFTNVSSMPCSLLGYPDLRLLDGAGSPLDTKIKQETIAFLWNGVPTNKVQLEPDGSAYFKTQVTDAPQTSGDVCVTAASVIVYPPERSAGLTVAPTFSFGTCNGVIYISPTVAQLSEL